MQELASVAVGAIGSLMELGASLSFEIRREMSLFVKLMLAVSKGTLIEELALAKELPVPTHFGFVFHLVLLHELVSLIIRIEMLFRLLQSRFKEFNRILFFHSGQFFVGGRPTSFSLFFVG